jgi:hypothetical protein
MTGHAVPLAPMASFEPIHFVAAGNSAASGLTIGYLIR